MIPTSSSTRTLSLTEFLAIPPFPRQTRTLPHSVKLKKSIDETGLDETGRQVVVIEVGGENGDIYKGDGHTRAYLWEKNLIPRPARVNVTIYRVATMKQAIPIFNRFNSAKNLRTNADILSGALQYYGVEAVSPFWKSGKFTGVLKTLYEAQIGRSHPAALTEEQNDQIVNDWKEEIKMIDSFWSLDARAIKAGVAVAALMTLRKSNGKAMTFWKAYYSYCHARSKEPLSTHHPVYMAHKASLDATRGNSRANMQAKFLAPKVIECVERFMAGFRGLPGEKGGIVGINSLTYLNMTPQEIQALVEGRRKSK